MNKEPDHCTCNKENIETYSVLSLLVESNIEEHTCPYNEEINDDYETLCRCCPYCVDQCRMDI